MPRALRPASRAVAVLALLVTLGVSLGRAPTAGRASGADWQSVVVQAASGDRSAAELVRRAGGTVTVELPIVSGFAARVPAASLPALQALPGVRAVTPDRRVHVATSDTGSSTNVKSVFAREVNADRLWAEGVNGTGVRVALVDTGVSRVPDLADRLVRVQDPARSDGALVDCVNFSGEEGCEDTYGHGTFVGGLIAGTGAASGGRYRGIAPGAELISLKIAGRDGASDVSKVLAAIQWVVSFGDRYGVRVLNLSLGTDSTASYRHDPLNYAVERAWRAGITVVVSASNRGPNAGTISKPGDDPFVITVGAVDDRQTPSIDDDRLPRFSGRGPTADGLSKPDLTAPGARLVSLRSPGSHIEAAAPGGVDDTYRRGSGTSMSAGVVSGITALVLQANREWSPDRLKFALTATARRVADDDRMAVGAGLVDAHSAARKAPAGLANQGVAFSDGTGPLEWTRGTLLVWSCSVDEVLAGQCELLSGEQTAQGAEWDAQAFLTSDWAGSSWYGSSWYGSSWYGSSWYGSSWYGSSWYGTSDDGTSYGVSVAGSSWYGAWD
jgi:serine protease AprX